MGRSACAVCSVHGNCRLAKGSWTEIQFVEGDSVYLMNNNTNLSSEEGLGVFHGNMVAEFKSKAGLGQEGPAGQ